MRESAVTRHHTGLYLDDRMGLDIGRNLGLPILVGAVIRKIKSALEQESPQVQHHIVRDSKVRVEFDDVFCEFPSGLLINEFPLHLIGLARRASLHRRGFDGGGTRHQNPALERHPPQTHR